jgi:predicted DNA-binding transcriptional regulator YafY
MSRNKEVIRQWTILKELESSRRVTIDDLARRTRVSTRTIRRDLEALQTAGFPIYDDTYEGKKYWTLEQKAFRRLHDTGFTLAELNALYFSRTLVEGLSGTPFERAADVAFDKLAGALTPGMKQLFDRMALVMQAKADPGTQAVQSRTAEVAKLLEATMQHRRVTMRYYSFSSNREKEYTLEPYRLIYGQGGLYVIGMVPEYGALRTFAVDRIAQLSLTEERFEPLELPDDAFAHSLGVNQGTPERVEIAFAPRIARYVRERVWHPSQEIHDEAGGGLRLILHVVHDWALKSWILGFGALARVVAPESLAVEIGQELEAAAGNYREVVQAGAVANGPDVQ